MDWIYESQSWFNLELLDSIQLYLSWNEMRVLEIITVENWVIRIRSQKYLFSSISQPSILCLGRPLFHFSEASAGIYCISYAINKATVSSLNWASRLCGIHKKEHQLMTNTSLKGRSFGQPQISKAFPASNPCMMTNRTSISMFCSCIAISCAQCTTRSVVKCSFRSTQGATGNLL
jgi:hypothetical protein